MPPLTRRRARSVLAWAWPIEAASRGPSSPQVCRACGCTQLAGVLTVVALSCVHSYRDSAAIVNKQPLPGIREPRAHGTTYGIGRLCEGMALLNRQTGRIAIASSTTSNRPDMQAKYIKSKAQTGR